MPEEITNAIGTVSMSVLVQAIITLILTCAVVTLVVLNRDIPQTVMTAWLVSLGLWMPQPSNQKSP